MTLVLDFTATRAASAPAALQIAVVGLFALLMHAPAHGLVGPDDWFFLAVAHFWSQGFAPYLHAFDVKPPGLFLPLAAAGALFGPAPATLNGLTALADAGTAICLWRLGRRWGGAEAGLFAGIGFPLLSQMLAANAAYPLLAAATAAAFLMASQEGRLRAALAGLALGYATTIKQTAVLEGLAALWLVSRNRDFASLAAFVAGASAPWLAFLSYFACIGGLAAFLEGAVTLALLRPGADGETMATTWAHFRVIAGAIWPLLAAACLAVAGARLWLPGRAFALALWLLASLLELWLQHARWTNYLGPVLAPALLLAGQAGAAISSPAARRIALAALLVMVCATAFPWRNWSALAPEETGEIDAAAAVIAAQEPQPGDRLLAMLDATALNVRLNLAPPTRYFHHLHLLCAFPGAGPVRLREALEEEPRFIALPSGRPRPHCYDPAAWPLVEAALAGGYRRLGGTPGLDLYERVSR